MERPITTNRDPNEIYDVVPAPKTEHGPSWDQWLVTSHGIGLGMTV
jgi:hypothetical protein